MKFDLNLLTVFDAIMTELSLTRAAERLAKTQSAVSHSLTRLRKLTGGYDAGDRLAALSHIAAHEARGEILTGLLYVNADAQDLHAHLKTVEAPLNRLGVAELCPGSAVLAAINAEMA